MAQSITKSQAELLASGFLDTIGSSPEQNDIQFNETLIALIKIAGYLIQQAGNSLHESGHVSSGALIDSFKVLDPELVNNVIHLNIEALYYYQFLNKGVKGTKSGSGKYQFKSSYPSKKMVTEIETWIKRAGLSTYNVKKSVSKLEKKNKSISGLDQAYAVARSIKMKGIKGNGFFDRAIKSAQAMAKEELGKALTVDIINTLPKRINNGNSNK